MSAAGFIYFIEAVGTDAIKIGWAMNPARRAKLLATGCPLELKILAVVPARRFAEAGVHAEFKATAIRGEWFRKEPQILGFIASVIAAGRLPEHLDITEGKTPLSFGKRTALSDFLRARNLTCQGFAAKIGATETAVRKWLRGERFPRSEMLLKIVKMTDGEVTIDTFLNPAKGRS